MQTFGASASVSGIGNGCNGRRSGHRTNRSSDSERKCITFDAFNENEIGVVHNDVSADMGLWLSLDSEAFNSSDGVFHVVCSISNGSFRLENCFGGVDVSAIIGIDVLGIVWIGSHYNGCS